MRSPFIKQIPSQLDVKSTNGILTNHNSWFYEFSISNGVSTSVQDPLINIIHQTRADIIFPFLDNLYGRSWSEISCLDIACNQGWFATQIALRNAKKVLGIDIRNEHIEMASAIKEIGNLSNLDYIVHNLFETNSDEIGQFDLTLFLGLLYHLENPMGALRKVRSLTKKMCVIETQVARDTTKLDILNGSDTNIKQGSGIGVFQADENHVEGDLSVVLVPTLEALYQMLYAVGFDRIYLSVPPKSMFNQYPDFDRVIIFAQVLEK